ncbi:MAG: phenylacetate--CoA ligase family protein, partial [Pyrinomonadaceae bacterium]
VRANPDAFLCGRADTAFETTGTTSPVPKRIYFSNAELNAMGRASAFGLYQLGLRGEDRILSAYDSSFWVSPAVLRSALRHLNCFHVEAGKIPPADFYEHARIYRPNVIFGEPSWVVRLSEIAEKRGIWDVKFLFAGGENIAEESRRFVENIWNAPLYLNYGQTEGFGSLGVECRAHQGYHRNDLNFIFETPEPDADGFGELVYTTLTREVMPLIRYRSTDVTKLVEEECECGLPAKRLARIRSRKDEMIVCGMGNISPWIFNEILRDVPLLVGGEWQVRVWHENLIDTIELRVETAYADQMHIREAVSENIMENLKTRFPDFWKNLEMKLYDFRIVPVMRETLRTARKLKRIVALDAPPADEKPSAEIVKTKQAATFVSNGNGFSQEKI